MRTDHHAGDENHLHMNPNWTHQDCRRACSFRIRQNEIWRKGSLASIHSIAVPIFSKLQWDEQACLVWQPFSWPVGCCLLLCFLPFYSDVQSMSSFPFYGCFYAALALALYYELLWIISNNFIFILDVECLTLGGEPWTLNVKCVAEIDQIDQAVNYQIWHHATVDKSIPSCSPTWPHIWIEGDR